MLPGHRHLTIAGIILSTHQFNDLEVSDFKSRKSIKTNALVENGFPLTNKLKAVCHTCIVHINIHHTLKMLLRKLNLCNLIVMAV